MLWHLFGPDIPSGVLLCFCFDFANVAAHLQDLRPWQFPDDFDSWNWSSLLIDRFILRTVLPQFAKQFMLEVVNSWVEQPFALGHLRFCVYVMCLGGGSLAFCQFQSVFLPRFPIWLIVEYIFLKRGVQFPLFEFFFRRCDDAQLSWGFKAPIL